MADGNEAAPGGVEPISVITVDNPIETFPSASAAGRALAAARHKKSNPEAKPITQAAPVAAETAPEQSATELAPEVSAEPAQAPGENAPAVEPETPAINPPNAWSAEEKERFKTYPPELQSYLAQREQDRDRDLQKHQREAAETRKKLESEHKAAEQVRTQYEQALPALLQTMHDQQQGEFADIRTMADVNKMATEDWPRYIRWDANQKQIAAVTQEIRATQERQGKEAHANWSKFATEQDTLFAERVPEMADKAKASKITESAVSTLKDVGFNDDELGALWNTKEFRDHRMQTILYKAARFDEAEKRAREVVKKPIPPVQRPGASQSRVSEDSAQITSLAKKFEQTGNPRDAAALVAARRAANTRPN